MIKRILLTGCLILGVLMFAAGCGRNQDGAQIEMESQVKDNENNKNQPVEAESEKEQKKSCHGTVK